MQRLNSRVAPNLGQKGNMMDKPFVNFNKCITFFFNTNRLGTSCNFNSDISTSGTRALPTVPISCANRIMKNLNLTLATIHSGVPRPESKDDEGDDDSDDEDEGAEREDKEEDQEDHDQMSN